MKVSNEKRIAILKRRAQILESLVAGMSYSQIAEAVDISKTQVARDIAAIKGLMIEKLGTGMEEHVTIQNTAIDAQMNRLWPETSMAYYSIANGFFNWSWEGYGKKRVRVKIEMSGEQRVALRHSALQKVIQLWERKARLLGLDAPAYLRVNDVPQDELLNTLGIRPQLPAPK